MDVFSETFKDAPLPTELPKNQIESLKEGICETKFSQEEEPFKIL